MVCWLNRLIDEGINSSKLKDGYNAVMIEEELCSM